MRTYPTEYGGKHYPLDPRQNVMSLGQVDTKRRSV